MKKWTRRQVLERAGWVGVGAVTLGPTLTWSSGCGEDDPIDGTPTEEFRHGVASGDPLTNAVILWTRVTPAEAGPVDLTWEVASDHNLRNVVQSGLATTDASRDYTVKVDAGGLTPGRTYYYRFYTDHGQSLVGRTRTLPEGRLDNLRFGVLSCSSYPHGYFHAYRHAAERLDLDAAVHLGDYIYEYGNDVYGSARWVEPDRDIVFLDEYRTRHAHYRLDPDLQAIHQMVPFIAVWDDHESANDSWQQGAENHDQETQGDWHARKDASVQAYAEWLPIREQPDPLKIWRSFQFGDLVELIMLDTRLWGRDAPVDDRDNLDDPTRRLLGDDQKAWLAERLMSTSARWKVLGQQVMMGQLLVGGSPLNLDQWDGYPRTRHWLLSLLRDAGIDDVVVLTGDIHSSWANDLSTDPLDPAVYDPETGEGSVAVEFVTTSVTSPALADTGGTLSDIVRSQNPHVKYLNLLNRGFMVVDVTRERAQADWYHLDGIGLDQGNLEHGVSFLTRAGHNRLELADAPTSGSSRGRAPDHVPPRDHLFDDA
jgi:alkaline phosphatase D